MKIIYAFETILYESFGAKSQSKYGITNKIREFYHDSSQMLCLFL